MHLVVGPYCLLHVSLEISTKGFLGCKDLGLHQNAQSYLNIKYSYILKNSYINNSVKRELLR